jgi:hypothetical protein
MYKRERNLNKERREGLALTTCSSTDTIDAHLEMDAYPL